MSAKKSIPERLWKSILANMPIPCVDIIVHTRVGGKTRVLLGYRKIYPYNDKWALPGGRIVKRESLRATANRQLKEIGIHPTGGYKLVGVYPVNFKRRSDISICLSTRLRSPQEPRPTREMAKYAWSPLNDLPSGLGSNYRTMLRDFESSRYTLILSATEVGREPSYGSMFSLNLCPKPDLASGRVIVEQTVKRTRQTLLSCFRSSSRRLN